MRLARRWLHRDDVRLAETTLRAFQGVYDPVLEFNPEISNLVQSQQSTLGGGSNQCGTVTTTDFRFDNSVTKYFGFGGGNYRFFFNNNRRTTDSRFNVLNPVFSTSAGVTFTQPLWRDRSIDNNRRQIRIQRKRLEQSDADFRSRTDQPMPMTRAQIGQYLGMAEETVVRALKALGRAHPA
jgi:hypothetical protein